MFRDEDIDQQLPARLNDSELGMDQGKPRSCWKQCIMDAPVYHIKYARPATNLNVWCLEIVEQL
jgi:hypothetical protein